MASFGSRSNPYIVGQIVLKNITLNLLDFKHKNINDILQNISDSDGQVKVNYDIDKTTKITKIEIEMKQNLKYLSIGPTIANGIMLPHLDLCGNNISFFQEQ